MMDVQYLDSWLVFPALFFTVLAVFVAAVVLRKNESPSLTKSFEESQIISENTQKSSELGRSSPLEAHLNSLENRTETDQQPLSGKDFESQSATHTAPDLEDDTNTSPQTIIANKCETAMARNEESGALHSGKREVNEDKNLRYKPGMLRTSQLEKMMSKEELEEERRVQQEQLAAIFKLLKENQETFGDVTENDMEEQLKLYSI
ncbi:uncharacterized protein [Hoplias malabaricus]|uniref:uncharacterized protein n=1 Tax=Hoplias malabaricus TaxID=27720 RepID=UPI00346334F9